MTYIVADIEADGPFPAANAMLNLAAVVVSDYLVECGVFDANLEPPPDTRPSPSTVAWFEREAPAAWRRINADQRPPVEVMRAFVEWVEGFPKPRIFVAHPLIFDGAWIDHYLGRYTRRRLFSYAGHADALFDECGLDLSSLAMGVLKLPLEACRREHLPGHLTQDLAHTHLALDDARGYAALLRNLLA